MARLIHLTLHVCRIADRAATEPSLDPALFKGADDGDTWDHWRRDAVAWQLGYAWAGCKAARGPRVPLTTVASAATCRRCEPMPRLWKPSEEDRVVATYEWQLKAWEVCCKTRGADRPTDAALDEVRRRRALTRLVTGDHAERIGERWWLGFKERYEALGEGLAKEFPDLLEIVEPFRLLFNEIVEEQRTHDAEIKYIDKLAALRIDEMLGALDGDDLKVARARRAVAAAG